jgi:dephospho-CoA kinase
LKVIGLLGGVASGKSVVAEQFCRLGAVLLDGDRAGHAVLRQAEVMAAIRERWGDSVFTASGEVDRRAVARRVFAPPPEGPFELAFLEKLTHPRIGEILRRQAEEAEAQGKPLAILDAAVMLKAGWNKFCNTIIFVEVPKEVRMARARARGWNDEEFNAREAAQEILNVKRKHADVTIDNSGSLERTKAQIQQLWPMLVG